jgi:hypothetical protein
MLQRVVARVDAEIRELLYAGRCREAEWVQGLIVVACDEELDAPLGETVHECQVHRVEVLELVDDEVVDTQQARWIEQAGLHLLYAQRRGR